MDSQAVDPRSTTTLDTIEAAPRKKTVTYADAFDASVAKQGTQAEQDLTFGEAVRLYPKAIAWSLLLSTTIIMEGFDLVLIGTFYAFPQFSRKYGELTPSGAYEVPASWQTGLVNGAQAGEIVGLFINGYVAERFGYRKTMVMALVLMIAAIFIPFFAPSIEVLFVGMIVQGIPWGVFQTLTISYAAEVCPMQLRAHLTTYVNMCWVIGQLTASGILRSLLDNETQWAYRIPFALQWAWPLPILVGMIWAPESPWWLVRHGRLDDAKRVMMRLTRRGVDDRFSAEAAVASIAHTNDMEKRTQAGTSYKDCFAGVNRRRTEIVCVAWAIQNICGSAFMSFSTVLYQRAGLSTVGSFNMSMVQYAIGAAGTITAWFLVRHMGRRTLYLVGLTAIVFILCSIGFLGAFADSRPWAPWTIAALLLVYVGVFNTTIGPVAYTVVSEMSSTRLRGKTVVLGRNTYLVCGIVSNVLTPYQLSPTAWNWGAKTGLFWGGISLLCTVWTFFRLPEAKGRTYGELDMLFEHHVPARKFSTTPVDQFQHDEASTAHSGGGGGGGKEAEARGPAGQARKGKMNVHHREYVE